MRGRAQRKRDRQPPGDDVAKIAQQRRRQHQKQGHRPGAQGKVESKKRRQFWLLHVSRRVTHNSTAWLSNIVSPSRYPPSRPPTAWEGMFSRSMQWMILSNSNVANDQSIAARAAST